MTVPPVPPILERRPTDPAPNPGDRPPRPRRDLRPTVTRLVVLLAVVAVVVLTAQLFSGEPTTEPAPDTDAPVVVDPAPEDDTDTTSPVGLPSAVELTAARIEEAVVAEDWDRLAELALAGDAPFTATFGEELTTVEDLAAYWRGLATEEDLPRIVTELLALPDWSELEAADLSSGVDITLYVTPRFMHDPSPEARTALEDALGAEWLELQIADGQYLGWRIGITADGDWLFLVQGD